MRELFASVLESLGFAVVEAESTDEAVMLLAGDIVLAVVDLDSASHSGLDLLRAMRESRPDVRIICVGADRELLTQAGSEGADALLTESFSRDDIRVLALLLSG